MRKKRKTNFMHATIAILSILMLITTIGCGTNLGNTISEKEDVFKIGFMGPLSGDTALYGENPQKGVLLAITKINADGGINGKQIKLISENTKCEPKEGVNAIKKLIYVDEVEYIIGASCSSVTLASAPIAEENKVIMISPVSTNHKVSDAGEYIFRTVPSDALQGKKGAEISIEKGYKKAAILFINTNDYGKGLEKAFGKEFETLGGEVVISESHSSGESDFRTQLLKIKSKNPDVIYLATQTKEATLIIKQAKELGLNIPLIGTEVIHDSQFLESAKEAAEGILFTSFSEYEGKEAKLFSEEYKSMYGIEKEIYSDYGYDAIYALLKAIESCEKSLSSQCVKQELYSVEFIGATGNVNFDENGDVNGKDFSLFQVENNKFVRLK